MREIALHILDLLENSIRAQATVIAVTVEAWPPGLPGAGPVGLLRIAIEDNGTGLKVSPAAALDPFYTTKSGKRTGLGLSLFRGAAEATGGSLRLLASSRLGDPAGGRPGVTVVVEMGLQHVDRNPLGDLGGTLSSVVATNPEIDFQVRLRLGGRTQDLDVVDLARELGEDGHGGFAVACQVMERVNAELKSAQVLV